MAEYDSTGQRDPDGCLRFQPITEWPRYLGALRERGVASFMVNADDYEHVGPYERGVVYAHVLDKSLYYVGMSMDWERRREQHRAARDWDEEWLFTAPLEWPWEQQQRWAYSMEHALIGHFAPPYNYAPGRGTRWTADIGRILAEQQFAYPGCSVEKRQVQIVRGPVMRRP